MNQGRLVTIAPKTGATIRRDAMREAANAENAMGRAILATPAEDATKMRASIRDDIAAGRDAA